MTGYAGSPSETRWVIKIGSSLLTQDGKGLDYTALAGWVDEISGLHNAGMEIVVVSSGAVAEGLSRLGWRKRPSEIAALQAAAAVGQMGLMQAYEINFRQRNICSAQVLLTHEDFSSRQRYLNVKGTLNKLAQMRSIAVVNENDTVSTEEICFGDNDMLAALVGNMIKADRLVILTDQVGLLTSDPRTVPNAELIQRADAEDERLLDIAGGAGHIGRGGMLSKVKSARMFALSGGTTTIASGRTKGVLEQIRRRTATCTELVPSTESLPETERWLAGQLTTYGTVVVDSDALQALLRGGKSIQADDVLGVRGSFQRDDVVTIASPDERAVAKGLSNYSAQEIQQVVMRSREHAPSNPRVDPRIIDLIDYRNIAFNFFNKRE
ncbi:glutamate 5-kinase [Paraburkholderia monticola]|uniref:glutamate 5-kinase n=1 Tax=Paraburkholderia monticola TaxID=1399968 RepID=UPI00094F77A3|nr:glutamate 5-kinase [Paraburkholderia monticola]